jgi:carboxyl-terminal processing protease
LDLFDPFGPPENSPVDNRRTDGSEPGGPAMEPWMKRHFKSLVMVAVLAIASILTVTHRGATGGAGGLGIDAVESLRAAPATSGEKRPYDLASLHIFDSALKRINDSYVDPTRIDPKQMLLSSLDNVQKQVAEVLVEPHVDQNKVVVRVDTKQREFSIADVDSPWTLSLKMREIFKFVSANIQPGTDLKELEYAATNGMLNTLDPHSVLLEPQVYAEMKLTTRGSFGGLGIVIGIRKNVLTVIKPMPNTPASAAGIKAGDHIVRIDKLSTTNMMLNDAVNRLRGDPETKVEVWIQRGPTPPK